MCVVQMKRSKSLISDSEILLNADPKDANAYFNLLREFFKTLREHKTRGIIKIGLGFVLAENDLNQLELHLLAAFLC